MMNLSALTQSDLASPSTKGFGNTVLSSDRVSTSSQKAAGFGQLMQSNTANSNISNYTLSEQGEIESFSDLLGLVEQYGEEFGIHLDKNSQQVVLDTESGEISLTIDDNAGKLTFFSNGEEVPLQQVFTMLLQQAVNTDEAITTSASHNQLINQISLLQKQVSSFSADTTRITQENVLAHIDARELKQTNATLAQGLLSADLLKPQVKAAVAGDTNVVSTLNTLVSSSNSGNTEALQFKASIEPSKQSNLGELGQKLNQILADKISVQLSAKNQVATVRLDPPDLGKIDLTIRVEHDKLQVQINASNQTTRESLNLTADRLRHELMGQNFLTVDVSIQQESKGSSSENFVSSEEISIQNNGLSFDVSDQEDDLFTNVEELARV